MLRFMKEVPGAIPAALIMQIPPGNTIREIEHSVDGNAAVLELIIGNRPELAESTNMCLGKVATPRYGGHQHWTGKIKTGSNSYYIKARMCSTNVGGSHNLIVYTEEA